MSDSLHTRLCDMLGCRYPIIQTAMGWVARPELVAASCNAGAFGFLAAAVMSAEEVGPAIERVRALTDRPFGVNFHMFQPGAERIVATLIAEKVSRGELRSRAGQEDHRAISPRRNQVRAHGRCAQARAQDGRPRRRHDRRTGR
jgi:NAD(P)H-dependent flavin oxidoreductase YrpB (nitropropane dioxygenase family)